MEQLCIEKQLKETEAQLQETQRHLSILMANMPGMAYQGLHDEHRTMTFVSVGCEKLIGYQAADLVEKGYAFYGQIIHPDDRERVLADIQSALVEKQSFETAYRICCANGAEKWVCETGGGIFSADGELEAIEGFISDITSCKQSEEDIKQSLERFELAMLGSSDGIWDGSILTNEGYYSPRFKELLGYQDDPFPNRLETFFSLIHPYDYDDVVNAIQDHAQKRAPYDIEYRMRTKSGEYRWFSARGQGLWDESGRMTRISGSIRDITERKQVDDVLQRSEERYRHLFESTGIATFVIEEDTTISMVNAEFQRHFGYPKNVIEGRSWTEFVLQEDMERLNEYHCIRRTSPADVPRNYELKFIDVHGNVRDVRISITLIPGTKKSIGSVVDITSRKEVENALRESEERYRGLFDAAGDGIAITDVKGILLDANTACCEMLGYSHDELVGMRVGGLIHPDHRHRLKDEFLHQVTDNGSVQMDTEGIRKDSTPVSVEIKGKPFSYHGQPASLVTIRDITKRKQDERKLADALARLNNVMDNAPDIICTFDCEGILESWNKNLETVMGFSAEELKAMSADEFFLPEKRGAATAAIKECYKNKQSETEEVIVTRDGTEIPYHWKAVSLRDEYGRVVGLTTIGRDITERKKAERALKQHSDSLYARNIELDGVRMELASLNDTLEQKVGDRTVEVERLLKHKNEFIGQVGHDLRSPLTPLVTLLPMIYEREQDSKYRELLHVCLTNVMFMKELVSRLLRLGELNSPMTKVILQDMSLLAKLRIFIESRTALAERQGVKIENGMEEDIIVRADAMAVKEVLHNLVGNALKFTPMGGTIRISAEKNCNFATISVADTGRGMTDEQVFHIFEEFYKADESRHDLLSHGLGLSICKRIVEQHGGGIWAESLGLGKGSTLFFTIPLSGAGAQMEW